MELNYSLTENDYLQQQLYLASKSKQIKRQRERTNIMVGIIIIVIMIVMKLKAYHKNNISLTITSVMVCLIYLWACFFVQKKYYVKIFRKYVNENFTNRFGVQSKLIFKEEVLDVLTDGVGISSVNFSNFKNISEIKDYFFIAFKTGENLMIPKDKIENAEELRNKLKSIAENLKIDFISELDWKWK